MTLKNCLLEEKHNPFVNEVYKNTTRCQIYEFWQPLCKKYIHNLITLTSVYWPYFDWLGRFLFNNKKSLSHITKN